MTAAYEVLPCPMPDCSADLYITVTANRAVYASDTAEELSLHSLDDAHTTTWSIGCSEGHVVLLPIDHAGDYERFGSEHEIDDDEPCVHDDLGRLHRLGGSA